MLKKVECYVIFRFVTICGKMNNNTGCNTILVGTSSLFCLIGVNGLLLNEYFLGLTAITSGLVSMNFWRKEIMCSLRHRVDRIVARISFMNYSIYTLLYIEENIDILYYLCLITTCLYCLSLYCGYRYRTRVWMVAHVLFHICVCVGQYLIIISNGSNNQDTKKKRIETYSLI